MTTALTARVLLYKAINRLCGKQCVDWAVELLFSDVDGENVRMLSSKAPPFNHFELAALRDAVVADLGIGPFDAVSAAQALAGAEFERVLTDVEQLKEIYVELRDLYLELHAPDALRDFCSLAYAIDDLAAGDFSYYWPDATRENINEILTARAVECIRQARALPGFAHPG